MHNTRHLENISILTFMLCKYNNNVVKYQIKNSNHDDYRMRQD